MIGYLIRKLQIDTCLLSKLTVALTGKKSPENPSNHNHTQSSHTFDENSDSNFANGDRFSTSLRVFYPRTAFILTFIPESSSSWLVGPLGVPKTEEDSAGRVITRPKDARNPDPRQAPCFGALPGSCRPRPWRYASFFPVFKPTHVRASRVFSSPSSVPSAALTNKQPSPLPTRAVLAHSWC